MAMEPTIHLCEITRLRHQKQKNGNKRRVPKSKPVTFSSFFLENTHIRPEESSAR